MTRLRTLTVMLRPPVVILLGLFAALGVASSRPGSDAVGLVEALVPTVAFLLFSIAVNDLADEAIDRANLANQSNRPLVRGWMSRRDMAVIAVAAAGLALSSAAVLLPVAAVAVVTAGLVVSACYSLPPMRVASRGALASLLLPAGYVAVPFLLGVLATRSALTATDLRLLAGLYVGFIGRILLKDFRDVHGDALFGKRTFLVRHGRVWTCRFSAVAWTAGSVLLVWGRPGGSPVAASLVVYLGVAVALLRALSVDRGPRRDERIISALAVLGRGTLTTCYAGLLLKSSPIGSWAKPVIVTALTVVVLGTVGSMAQHGPRARLTYCHLDGPAIVDGDRPLSIDLLRLGADQPVKP